MRSIWLSFGLWTLFYGHLFAGRGQDASAGVPYTLAVYRSAAVRDIRYALGATGRCCWISKHAMRRLQP
ncbi:MAG TPA: hypothetical protein VN616_13880 [Puia sp.]|nr:hypothetical protein [Puia sp.]